MSRTSPDKPGQIRFCPPPQSVGQPGQTRTYAYRHVRLSGHDARLSVERMRMGNQRRKRQRQKITAAHIITAAIPIAHSHRLNLARASARPSFVEDATDTATTRPSNSNNSIATSPVRLTHRLSEADLERLRNCLQLRVPPCALRRGGGAEPRRFTPRRKI